MPEDCLGFGLGQRDPAEFRKSAAESLARLVVIGLVAVAVPGVGLVVPEVVDGDIQSYSNNMMFISILLFLPFKMHSPSKG